MSSLHLPIALIFILKKKHWKNVEAAYLTERYGKDTIMYLVGSYPLNILFKPWYFSPLVGFVFFFFKLPSWTVITSSL